MPIPPRMNFSKTTFLSLAASLCLLAQSTAATALATATIKYPPRFLMEQGDDCVVVDECQLCDAASRAEIPQCAATGRVVRWRCDGAIQEEGGTVAAGTGTVGTIFMNRSCKRTKEDDEFLMVRFQVFCVLIGTAAFVSARKQKYVGASLFEQRKLASAAAAEKNKRRSSVHSSTNEIEMAQRSEMVPLTDDAVDIV